MYANLPFGPVTIPTGPFLAVLAAIIALEVGARAGRRLRLHPDDVWNTGLLALLAGLIVARLWTILQFWPVYRAEPLLLVSLRPSGFAFWPGLVAALVAGYANLLRRRLDPVRMAAALAVGLVAGGVIIGVSVYLTGAVVGTASEAPWAVRFFLERVHPTGLYRALGLSAVLIWLWLTLDAARPGRTFWQAVLGFALVSLAGDAFVRDPDLVGLLRRSQLLALLAAVTAALALSRASVHTPLPGSPAPSLNTSQAAPPQGTLPS